ncbi:uncharacterized protein LOC121976606 isoform X1 [Zingiber officinale]|uniref:uncharacterized protein LOC121976606 isoform X1 n=1 Tax=Zingiber officinale TaxID=94328 RepID=UPI001C4A8ED2|nr:uncharacterized protein LOC121976606 isoform X1 [Zingiber officinale]XP_042384774.1 uncharacterized protein LOC121976606 isoform X1 [Zingiber officinale]
MKRRRERSRFLMGNEITAGITMSRIFPGIFRRSSCRSGAKLDCGDPDRPSPARGPLRYDLIDSLFKIDPNNTEGLIGGPHCFNQSIRGTLCLPSALSDCRRRLESVSAIILGVRTLAKQETDLVLELHAYRHQGLIDCRESIMTRYLDLQSFILRSRVLKFYRQALRTARRAPIHARDELRQTMRQEMEKNRHCDDRQKIRFLLSEGMQRLKGLDEMLDMMGHN